MSSEESYINERLDHLGIVAGVCQEIGLAAWLDAQDPIKLFAGIARQARQIFGVKAEQVHVDTTSFSVSGEHRASARKQEPDEAAEQEELAAPEATLMAIIYGYSRDHREDLKQWMLALATTPDGDIPLLRV